MFRTSKSKLAHATVLAGTISMLLSSSALAGFHVGGGVRATSFVRAPAMARVTAAIHPSFDRGSVLRSTNSPDRFGGARAVYRPPFPSNGIAGLASHPQGNLPAEVATLKGAPYGISSGWHAPSVGGNPAPSPDVAAYGVTVGTPPVGATVAKGTPYGAPSFAKPGAPASAGIAASGVTVGTLPAGATVARATPSGAQSGWLGQSGSGNQALSVFALYSSAAVAAQNTAATLTTGHTAATLTVPPPAPQANPTAPGLTYPLPYFPPPPFVQIREAAQQAANAAKAAANTAAAANGAVADAQYGAQEAQTYANQTCNTAAMVQQSLENPPGTPLGPQALALLQELVDECTTAQAAASAADAALLLAQEYAQQAQTNAQSAQSWATAAANATTPAMAQSDAVQAKQAAGSTSSDNNSAWTQADTALTQSHTAYEAVVAVTSLTSLVIISQTPSSTQNTSPPSSSSPRNYCGDGLIWVLPFYCLGG